MRLFEQLKQAVDKGLGDALPTFTAAVLSSLKQTINPARESIILANAVWHNYKENYRDPWMKKIREVKASTDQYASYTTSSGLKILSAYTLGTGEANGPLTLGMALELEQDDDVKMGEMMGCPLLGYYPKCGFQIPAPKFRFPNTPYSHETDSSDETKPMSGAICYSVGRANEKPGVPVSMVNELNQSNIESLNSALERAEVLREQRFHLPNGRFFVMSVTPIESTDYDNIGVKHAYDTAKTIEMHSDQGEYIGGGIPTAWPLYYGDLKRPVYHIVTITFFTAHENCTDLKAPLPKIASGAMPFEALVEKHAPGAINSPERPEELKIGLPRVNQNGDGAGGVIYYGSYPNLRPLDKEKESESISSPWRKAGDRPVERQNFFQPRDSSSHSLEQHIYNACVELQNSFFTTQSLLGEDIQFEISGGPWMKFDLDDKYDLPGDVISEHPELEAEGASKRPYLRIHWGYEVKNCKGGAFVATDVPIEVKQLPDGLGEWVKSQNKLRGPFRETPLYDPTSGFVRFFIEGWEQRATKNSDEFDGFTYAQCSARQEIYYVNALKKHPEFKTASAVPVFGQVINGILFNVTGSNRQEEGVRINFHYSGYDKSKKTQNFDNDDNEIKYYSFFGEAAGFGTRALKMGIDGFWRGISMFCCNVSQFSGAKKYAAQANEVLQILHTYDSMESRVGKLIPNSDLIICQYADAPQVDHDDYNTARNSGLFAMYSAVHHAGVFSGRFKGYPETLLVWDQFNQFTGELNTACGSNHFLQHFASSTNLHIDNLLKLLRQNARPESTFFQTRRIFYKYDPSSFSISAWDRRDKQIAMPVGIQDGPAYRFS